MGPPCAATGFRPERRHAHLEPRVVEAEAEPGHAVEEAEPCDVHVERARLAWPGYGVDQLLEDAAGERAVAASSARSRSGRLPLRAARTPVRVAHVLVQPGGQAIAVLVTMSLSSRRTRPSTQARSLTRFRHAAERPTSRRSDARVPIDNGEPAYEDGAAVREAAGIASVSDLCKLRRHPFARRPRLTQSRRTGGRAKTVLAIVPRTQPRLAPSSPGQPNGTETRGPADVAASWPARLPRRACPVASPNTASGYDGPGSGATSAV